MINEIPVSFMCGNDLLHGIIHQAPNANTGVIIVVGGPQTRHGSHRSFVELARFLASNGISVLRFDYRGAGDSEGEIQSFEQTPIDIEAAVNYFKKRHPEYSSIVLWGLCDAASAIALFVNEKPINMVNKLILVNPWVRSESTEAQTLIKYYYMQRLKSLNFWKKLLSGKLNLMKSSRSLREKRQAAGKSQQENFVSMMLRGLTAFHGTIDIVLGENDITAQEFLLVYNNSSSWRKSGVGSITTIEQANHTFSSPTWKQQLNELTLKAIISS